MSTLIAALRSDNPLGGAPLSYSEADDVFSLQGVGEITAAKLLDFENRRQLVWADLVTREWALEMAAMKVRKEAAAKAEARAAEAAAAAMAARAAAAAVDVPDTLAPPAGLAEPAVSPAETGDIPAAISSRAGGATRVFGPPTPPGRRPAGVRAASTRFDLPAQGGTDDARVVWTEPPADEADEAADVTTTASAAAAWATASAEAAALGGETRGAGSLPPDGAGVPGAAALVPGGGGAWDPAFEKTAADWSSGRPPTAPDGVVTRRTERRSALKEAEHRKASGAAWLRVLLYVLIAVAIVVVLFVMQHGGL